MLSSPMLRGAVYDSLPAFRSGRPRTEVGYLRPTEGLEIPFGVIEGPEPGPVLLVTAGVHGSEFCSIEAALRLLRQPPATLRGTLVILPILNIEGFRARSIFVMPEDGRNLNHVFPGSAAGSASERLAHWLVTHVYPNVDAYLDLHNGDLVESLVPFTLFPSASAASRDLAVVFGLGIAVATPGKGFAVDAASRLGVPSLIAEVSGNGLWSEAMVGQLHRGIERVLHHLGMTRVAPQPTLASERLVTKWDPRAACDGLWYPAKNLSDEVQVGEVLGEITDLFGNTLQNVRSEVGGFVLYQLTSLSVRTGEALLGVATPLAT